VLEFLVGNAGADRVLRGSDYLRQGMPDGVLQVRVSIRRAAKPHPRRGAEGAARRRRPD